MNKLLYSLLPFYIIINNKYSTHINYILPTYYVIVRIHLFSFFQILKARGVLKVKNWNKYILSILVYNPFLYRQRNISIHRYFSCLREIEMLFGRKKGWH